MKPIQITAVSYLNTKPFLYGLLRSDLREEIDLQLDVPSLCARKLETGEATLGLVPVAALPYIKTPHLISDYCIGATGAVRTVSLLGDVPVSRMKRIYLDYQSRTSVELIKLLLQSYWKVSPDLVPAKPGFEQEIGGQTGGLIIGDRVIELESRFSFNYDLGEAWQQMTGLPFVFAAWVSTRPLPEEWIQRFNLALKQGLEDIPNLILLLPQPRPGFDLKTYFTENISYELDAAKRLGLERFLRNMRPELQSSLIGSLAV